MLFTESAANQFFFNFVYIFYLLLAAHLYGIRGLMVASVLAVAAQVLYQAYALKKAGYKYQHVFNVRDKYLREVLWLVPPVLLGIAIDDVNIIVDRALASTLVTGTISALSYSNRFTTLVLGVFVTAITIVIFPMLAQASHSTSYVGVKRIMGRGINSILLITVPATVGIIAFARPIVAVAFERGAFDSAATGMTASALTFYALGLIGMGLRPLLTRAFYALSDTRTPVVLGAISVVINILLNLALIGTYAHRGLALATSMSTTTATGLMLFMLRKKIGPLGGKHNLVCAAKALVAATVMGVLAYFTYNLIHRTVGGTWLQDLCALMSSVGVGAVVYTLLIYLLRIEEVLQLVAKARALVTHALSTSLVRKRVQ
jgi:putative peptidoglycan lipid II flippase